MLMIYCDTCIYIDWFEWREGRKWIHYGDRALKLFKTIKEGNRGLIVSDHLDYQLKGYQEYKDYKEGVESNSKLKVMEVKNKDKKNANKMNNKHSILEYEDALHAELACRGDADALVTRNIRHFSPYTSKVQIVQPRGVKTL